MVDHTYNPRYGAGRIEGLWFNGSGLTQAKSMRTFMKNN